MKTPAQISKTVCLVLPHPARALRILVLVAVAVAFTVPIYSETLTSSAYSQVRKPKPRTNLMELLFGKRGSLNPTKRLKRATRVRLGKRKLRSVSAPAPAKALVKKKPGAVKILVAGDFMAGGLAWGLAQSFAENPDVVIVDITKGLSGFVRDDVKDWPGSISKHIDEVKPTALVFLSGMNDRQEMTLETGRVEKLSDDWLAIYNQRAEKLAKVITDKSIPFIWSGLPPVNSDKMSTDYLAFNEIFRSKAEAAGGTYVDVWVGFTNAEGQFVSAGPDINGQIKRLRTSDGINMTKTGKLKHAFYINRAIRKLTGIGTETLLTALPGIDDLRALSPQYNPAKTGTSIIYSLASPSIDGGTKLDGLNLKPKKEEAEKSVSYELIIEGKMPKTHKGRIDHYGIVANEVEAEPKKDESGS